MRDVDCAVQAFVRNVFGVSRLLAPFGNRCSRVGLARQVHGSGRTILLNPGPVLEFLGMSRGKKARLGPNRA
jgi:hypothetical protein